jgi:hypothetical protein
VNTIAATTNRIPRVGLIAIVALVAAFALLMVVRLGVFGGSSGGVAPVTASSSSTVTHTSTPAKPRVATKPAVVLLPGLPRTIASKLQYSRVVVVSLYSGASAGDRAAAIQARKGARSTGAGYASINLGNDANAAAMTSFVGPVSTPTLLVVRRPGRIVTTIPGSVEAAVVAQAAHNAGARVG